MVPAIPQLRGSVFVCALVERGGESGDSHHRSLLAAIQHACGNFRSRSGPGCCGRRGHERLGNSIRVHQPFRIVACCLGHRVSQVLLGYANDMMYVAMSRNLRRSPGARQGGDIVKRLCACFCVNKVRNSQYLDLLLLLRCVTTASHTREESLKAKQVGEACSDVFISNVLQESWCKRFLRTRLCVSE